MNCSSAVQNLTLSISSALSERTETSADLPCMQLCKIFERLRIAADPVDSDQIATLHDNHVQPRLEALLPWTAVAKHSERSVTEYPRDRQLSQALLKLINFAASNNFAGVQGVFSLGNMYVYFQPIFARITESWMSPRLPAAIAPRVSWTPSLYSTAETFFRSAIEAGDADAVYSLVQFSQGTLRVDDQVCNPGPFAVTAIEQSAWLQHLSLTKCLITLGADINKTLNTRSHVQGALECALSLLNGHATQWELTNQELVRTLVQAGGMIRHSVFYETIHESNEELVLLLKSSVRGSPNDWVTSGSFHRLAQRMSKDFLLALLKDLPRGIDFNISHQDYDYPRHDDFCCDILDGPGRAAHIIDILARRGEPEVIRTLRQYGAHFTQDSLTAAVISEDRETIDLVRDDNGTYWAGFSHHFHSTPFAEAVLSEDEELIRSLFESGCRQMVEEELDFAAGIAAAAQRGNDSLLESLLGLRSSRHAGAMGFALILALVKNCTTTATILLNAGASTNICGILEWLKSGAPGHCRHKYGGCHEPSQLMLDFAIHNRNAEMVQTLLRHDAVPLGEFGFAARHSRWQRTPLSMAVDWGHLESIETLLASKACHNQLSSALGVAVKKRDVQMVQYLLSAYSLHKRGEELGGDRQEDPLLEAVRLKDTSILRMLLDAGINCENSNALCEATSTLPEAFDFILKSLQMPKLRPSRVLNAVLVDAIEKSNHKAIEQLLNHGVRACAFVGPKFGIEIHSPLKSAILSQQDSDLCTVQAMLRAGADVKEIVSITPRRCDRHYNLYPVEWLGGYPAVFDLPLPSQTPLLVAISENKHMMVRLLVNWGADVNRPAEFNLKRTPLQKAAEVGSITIVKLLLECNADPNVPAAVRAGGTALQLAAIGGYIGIFELLLEHQADITAQPAIVDRRTPLEGAAEHGRLDMTSYLLRLFDQRGLLYHMYSELSRAKEFAAKNGHHVVADLLDQAMLQTDPTDWIARTDEDRYTECKKAIWMALGLGPWQAEEPDADVEPGQSNDSVAPHMLGQDVGFDSGGTSLNTYVCDECGSAMSNLSALRRHERIHTGARDFKCKACFSTFARKDTLNKHVSRHHQNS